MTDLFEPENIAAAIDWRVEQLRSTSFLIPMFDRSAEDVFRQIAQSAPTQVTENRQQALQTAAGGFASAKLDVIKQPGRIDVLLSPTDEARLSQGAVTTIGRWDEVVDSFNAGIRAWLPSGLELHRLALGAICQHEVTDRRAAYSILNRLLPAVDIDVEHSSDFLYQINRPRLANFDDSFSCKINRLSRWSAAAVVLQTVTIPTAEAAAQPPATATVRNYCRAELDLSTDAEMPRLPTHHFEDLWNKLTTFAGEMLSKGDIR